MNKSDTKIYFFFTAISFAFIIVTTDYLSLFDIIYTANQTDVISYTEIAKNSPSLPERSDTIIQHVAQRFLLPYTVGFVSNFFNIDLFLVFKIFTFVFIFLYIFIIYLLIKKFNFNLKVSVLFFSILFLNPYIVRYHVFNPIQTHDMLFFCLGLIFAFTIINKNFLINLFGTILSLYLRQTSIALLIGSSISLIINKKIKLLVVILTLYFLSFFIIIKIGQSISTITFPLNLSYKIIFFDFNQIEKLIKFLLLGVMPFFPLVVVLFGKINDNIKMSTLFILLLVCSMMVGQPILGGPDGSVNNVGRIANLCYPIVTVASFYIWNFEKFVKNKYLFYSFILGLFIWSLHPTYSILKLFGVFRFYNY